MTTYDTLIDALNDFRRQGFTLDFNLKDDGLTCQQTSIELRPADFDIVHVYRFEGATDPGDETVLYAIEAKDGGKGTLIDAYGAYSEAISPDMARKLGYTPDE